VTEYAPGRLVPLPPDGNGVNAGLLLGGGGAGDGAGVGKLRCVKLRCVPLEIVLALVWL